jgi:hypothetical protein
MREKEQIVIISMEFREGAEDACRRRVEANGAGR